MPPRLRELRAARLSEELAYTMADLGKVRSLHKRNADRRRREADAAREKERRYQELLARQKIREEAATRIQAAVRRMWVVRFVLPEVADAYRLKLLEAGRVELAGSLMSLRHTMHGLLYLDDHVERAATRIQAWWRGVLAVRVVSVLRIRRKMEEVHEIMGRAAGRVQARARGLRGRAACRRMRREMEERRLKVEREEHERMVRMVIKLQTWVRCSHAKREANRRRKRRSKELAAALDGSQMLRATSENVRRSLDPRGSNHASSPAAATAAISASEGDSHAQRGAAGADRKGGGGGQKGVHNGRSGHHAAGHTPRRKRA